MRTQRPYRIALVLLALLAVATSCSIDKYVGEHESILAENKYVIEPADESVASKESIRALTKLNNYTVQTPNKKFLWMRPKMRTYCLSNPSDSNFVNRTLRKQGEPPVIYNESATERTSQQLLNLMESKGCFTSTLHYDTAHFGHKNVRVTYYLHPSPRYKIRHVASHSENDLVQQLLNQWNRASLLKEDDYYDQDILAKERDRIANNLQNNGFFYASADNISFLIDSSFADNTLSIDVRVRDLTMRHQATHQQTSSLRQYTVDKIYIYPNSSALAEKQTERLDTLVYPYTFGDRTTDYYFIGPQPMTLAPEVIARSLFLFNGQIYQSRSVERSYNSLLNLRNFKYINFDFTPSPTDGNDSIGTLDATVRLINNTRRKVSLSLEVNNASPTGNSNTNQNFITSGNLGVEIGMAYQNKNLFGGAELLKVENSFLIEMPKIGSTPGDGKNFSAFEAGINISLDLPRLLLPRKWERIWQRSKPHTVFTIGGNYQDREYFERMLLNTSFGYSWGSNSRVQHQVLPIEMTFARFYDIDPAFWNRIENIASNGRLKYQYSSHFIINSRYDYVYSTQRFNVRRDFTSLHLSAETAGALAELLSRALNVPTDSSGIHIVYQVPFSQYVRLNGEVKRYNYIGSDNTFVTRLRIRAGLPYGNSDKMQMPYEKSFFGGGPTTMRAWHLRRLGPGYFSPKDNYMLERTGDITFVLNFEDRFPITGIFEGALFADIGNVWLLYDNAEYPGGAFTFKDFLPSMAVGIGVGLRAKLFSLITLRFDLGLPAYDPGYDSDIRWRIAHWNQYEWNWRKSYFGPVTLNFGIDYPF